MANLMLPEIMTRRQIRTLFKQHFGVMRQITKETGISESRITHWLLNHYGGRDVETACRRKAAELLGITTDRMTEIKQKASTFHPKD